MSFCGLIAVLFFFFLPIHCMDMASQVAQLVKNLPASAREARRVDSVSGLGRSPGRGNGNLFQYPCLENSKDRGAWWATVHGVTRVRHDFTNKPLPPHGLNQEWCASVDSLIVTKVFLCRDVGSEEAVWETKRGYVGTMYFLLNSSVKLKVLWQSLNLKQQQ